LCPVGLRDEFIPKIGDESVKRYFWYTRFIHRVKTLVGIERVLA
jgi:hypothetical protein